MGLVEQTKMIPGPLEFKKVVPASSCCDLGVMEFKFFSTCMSKEIMFHGSSDPKVEEQNTQCNCNPTKVAVGKLSNEVGK